MEDEKKSWEWFSSAIQFLTLVFTRSEKKDKDSTCTWKLFSKHSELEMES